jgi:hypothetical protein
VKKLQSFDGLVRERLQHIEARLSVGIRQELMVAELVAEGYEQANIKTLRNAIWRARKKLEAAATATPKKNMRLRRVTRRQRNNRYQKQRRPSG